MTCGKGNIMNRIFYDAVEENPIIAAIKNMEDLEQCCALEDIRVVFILFGDICSIEEIVHRVKSAGKVAMVHIDLIGGLSAREVAVEFLAKHTETDGIITTKPALIKKAGEMGMYTVLRYFLLDSMAYENILAQQKSVKPDFIEVLPGAMPEVLRRLCDEVRIPVIAGGLLTDRTSVMSALDAGAIAVSSTNHKVWEL
jgi:hypothetical protein